MLLMAQPLKHRQSDSGRRMMMVMMMMTQSSFSVDLEMPFGEPSLMPFANISGPLKTSDELDLMIGCIDHETEVAQDDTLTTPPIDTK